MNKKLLEEVMKAHDDKGKDLVAAIGIPVPNFSAVWDGRGEFTL